MNIDQILRIVRFNPWDYVWDFFRALLSLIITYLIFYSLKAFPLDSILSYGYIPLNKPVIEIITWVVVFFCLRTVSNFLKRGLDYHFVFNDWPKKWMFHGLNGIQANPAGLIIQHSRSGCLLKNYLWRNFEMEFELRFLPKQEPFDQSIGILFRAVNLDTYFMLEIHNRDKENSIYIKPHVRIDGFWEVIEDRKVGVGIDANDFLKLKLEVIDRIATLFINGKSIYEWLLPTHADLYENLNTRSSDNKQTSEAATVPNISFLNRYGMLGFRADWGQGAIIKSLRIKTFSKLDSILLIHRRFGL